MARRANITTSELNALLSKHNGDRSLVSEESGLTLKYISKRIQKVPQLRALWSNAAPLDPKSPDAETRTPPRGSDMIADKRSVDVWQKNGRDIFMTEVMDMLSDPANASKLDMFKGFAGNVGLHMARCLEMTQNVNIRQNITLFEVAEKLRDQLMNGGLDEESEILKTRLYLSCCEQQGKFHDRMLRGMEALIKMTEKEQTHGKKKAGFRPLSELKEAEETMDAQAE